MGKMTVKVVEVNGEDDSYEDDSYVRMEEVTSGGTDVECDAHGVMNTSAAT